MNPLRVMTFNVRQPDQDDGVNAWEARRDLLVDTILEQDPDLIGTQELFAMQADYILSRAPEYSWFGTGRFGDREDKHTGILYKTKRFQLLTCGDWWLSETPRQPGSASWGIVKPRQLTWGIFEADAIGTFCVINTHFPYRAVEHEARLQTARLIRSKLDDLPFSMPVIVTADANCQAGGAEYELLCEGGDGLRDAWWMAASRSGPEGTVHGFGRRISDRRIDWILYRGDWRVASVETVTAQRDGRYPSDHFPVIATFETVTKPVIVRRTYDRDAELRSVK